MVLAGVIAFGTVVACQAQPVPTPVVVERTEVQTVEVPVTVEVEATRIVERTVEVTREVDVTRQVEVTRQIPVTRQVVVTREVQVTREVEVRKEVPVTRQVEVTIEVPVTREVVATREVQVTRVVEQTREVEVEVTRTVEVTNVVIVTPTPDQYDLRRTPRRLCADYPYMIRVTELLRDFAGASVSASERGRPTYFPDASVARVLRNQAQSDLEGLIRNHVAICGLQPIPIFYETREMTTPEGEGICRMVSRGMFMGRYDRDVNDDASVEAFLDVTNAFANHCDNDFFQ